MPDMLASPMVGRSSVQASLGAAGLFCLVLLLVFHETTWSMVSIWLRSQTFAHGFLILPISLWLVWNLRDRLRLVNPRPALWVAFLLIPPGFVWLLAWLVDVLVVQQLALVAMLIIGAWAIMGHQLARLLVFPLLFLFFAVPMGEELVPPMMEFTATSTVWLIQQTGVPVYRDGLFFTLPSGNWSVVAACSGVRYIIASVTLGVLYAYLTYYSFWRRALFVLASAIVPVFANTARAYMIVMLGHVSDMTVATGVDHLIYGWAFFGLVIFLLFWLGSFFREDNVADPNASAYRSMNSGGADSSPSKPFVAVLVVLLAVAIWPLLAFTAKSRPGVVPVAITLPEGSGAWQAVPQPTRKWQPDSAVAGQVSAYYGLDGQTLGLYIQYSDGTEEVGEVVGSSTRFAGKSSVMRVANRDQEVLQFGDRTILVDQASLVGVDGRLLVWSWYRIGGLHTSNKYVAKFREAWASIGFGPSGVYRIVMALPLEESVAPTQAAMQAFLSEHISRMDELLNTATEGEE